MECYYHPQTSGIEICKDCGHSICQDDVNIYKPETDELVNISEKSSATITLCPLCLGNRHMDQLKKRRASISIVIVLLFVFFNLLPIAISLYILPSFFDIRLAGVGFISLFSIFVGIPLGLNITLLIEILRMPTKVQTHYKDQAKFYYSLSEDTKDAVDEKYSHLDKLSKNFIKCQECSTLMTREDRFCMNCGELLT